MNSVICYFGSDVEVRPGDRVETRVWFTRRRGRVVYVPGVSRFNSQFEFNGLKWVAIRSEEMIIGSVVDPRAGTLKKRVRFIERDSAAFDEVPDDSRAFEEGGGGWSP
jgi:hypothetical protein